MLSKRRVVLCVSFTVSRTGVDDLEDGEGVEGLDGDEGEEVVGLLLSADWVRFGINIPAEWEVRLLLAVGEGLRLGVPGVEIEVAEIPDMYLEATFRGFRVAGIALCFSEKNNSCLGLTSV